MNRFYAILTLGLLFATTAGAANLNSPAAVETYGSISSDGRKIADATVRSQSDIGAYCSQSIDDKRQGLVTAARQAVSNHEIQSATVGGIVTEVLKYAAAVCTSQ